MLDHVMWCFKPDIFKTSNCSKTLLWHKPIDLSPVTFFSRIADANLDAWFAGDSWVSTRSSTVSVPGWITQGTFDLMCDSCAYICFSSRPISQDDNKAKQEITGCHPTWCFQQSISPDWIHYFSLSTLCSKVGVQSRPRQSGTVSQFNVIHQRGNSSV